MCAWANNYWANNKEEVLANVTSWLLRMPRQELVISATGVHQTIGAGVVAIGRRYRQTKVGGLSAPNLAEGRGHPVCRGQRVKAQPGPILIVNTHAFLSKGRQLRPRSLLLLRARRRQHYRYYTSQADGRHYLQQPQPGEGWLCIRLMGLGLIRCCSLVGGFGLNNFRLDKAECGAMCPQVSSGKRPVAWGRNPGPHCAGASRGQRRAACLKCIMFDTSDALKWVSGFQKH